MCPLPTHCPASLGKRALSPALPPTSAPSSGPLFAGLGASGAAGTRVSLPATPPTDLRPSARRHRPAPRSRALPAAPAGRSRVWLLRIRVSLSLSPPAHPSLSSSSPPVPLCPKPCLLKRPAAGQPAAWVLAHPRSSSAQAPAAAWGGGAGGGPASAGGPGGPGRAAWLRVPVWPDLGPALLQVTMVATTAPMGWSPSPLWTRPA